MWYEYTLGICAIGLLLLIIIAKSVTAKEKRGVIVKDSFYITVAISGIVLFIGLIVSAIPFFGYYSRNAGQPKEKEYKMCELCDDRKATKGDYCSKCYNTLKGFQNTWG